MQNGERRRERDEREREDTEQTARLKRLDVHGEKHGEAAGKRDRAEDERNRGRGDLGPNTGEVRAHPLGPGRDHGYPRGKLVSGTRKHLPHTRRRWRDGPLASNLFESTAFIRSSPGVDRPDLQIVFQPARRNRNTFPLPLGHGFQTSRELRLT